MSYPEGIQITEKMIQEYLQFLERKGRKGTTLGSYQGMLSLWYEWLPEDKIIDADAVSNWEKELRTSQIAERTIRSRVSVLNRFLTYLESQNPNGKKENSAQKECPSPETALTREEYLMLLNTAKGMGRKRAYLLIKTIVCIGIRTQELQYLTVESVRNGMTVVSSRGHSRPIRICGPIKEELLAYAADLGVEEGPIFITRDGKPMLHSAIWKEVKKVCRELGISEEKGIPRSLRQLYLDTCKHLNTGSVEESNMRYLHLLMEEEPIIAWFE